VFDDFQEIIIDPADGSFIGWRQTVAKDVQRHDHGRRHHHRRTTLTGGVARAFGARGPQPAD
jgi:hypothetical protein